MKKPCTRCGEKKKVIKDGRYFRKGDSRYIQRYRCRVCNKSYSPATTHPTYRQKKRRINYPLMMYLASGLSLRRSAKVLKVAYSTVCHRLIYLGKQCQLKLDKYYKKISGLMKFEFDELQTSEHTKCKPLSVAVAVDPETRAILGFELSSMPATGHLAKVARKKYGFRPDTRKEGLRKLFQKMGKMAQENTTIISDLCPFYRKVLLSEFPNSNYQQFLGEKGCIVGQGELKKVGKDPLFYINHTLAMLRANVNRLIRRSWCTTKKPARLKDHLAIYVWVHNQQLIPQMK